MRLTDRLNVLIQATTLSQKSGTLTLEEAVNAKSAIDVIYSGILNQNFTAAINILIEIAISSQKKGTFSLKDAHMIYLAIDGIESELQNEVRKINEEIKKREISPQIDHMDVQQESNDISDETFVTVPPKKLKKIP
jgi:primase-polymerase (primpol)-like protein